MPPNRQRLRRLLRLAGGGAVSAASEQQPQGASSSLLLLMGLASAKHCQICTSAPAPHAAATVGRCSTQPAARAANTTQSSWKALEQQPASLARPRPCDRTRAADVRTLSEQRRHEQGECRASKGSSSKRLQQCLPAPPHPRRHLPPPKRRGAPPPSLALPCAGPSTGTFQSLDNGILASSRAPCGAAPLHLS